MEQFSKVKRISKDRASKRLFAVLSSHAREFVTIDTLCHETALNKNQVRRAVRFLKVWMGEHAEEMAGWSFVVGYDGLYGLTMDMEFIEGSRIERVNDIQARLETLYAYVRQMAIRCEDKHEKKLLAIVCNQLRTSRQLMADEEIPV
jgi:hypothetical protein